MSTTTVPGKRISEMTKQRACIKLVEVHRFENKFNRVCHISLCFVFGQTEHAYTIAASQPHTKTFNLRALSSIYLMDGSIATYTHVTTISHAGKTRQSGHYVSYSRRVSIAKPIEVGYYRASDAHFFENCQDKAIFESTALTGNGVQNETPYVLVYERTPTWP